MTISIGRKLAQQVIQGKFYEAGEWWPPFSVFHVAVNQFKFFVGDQDNIETFVIEAKCLKVLSVVAVSLKNKNKVRTVKRGDTRSHVIKMDKQPAAGNVVQFVGAALGSLMDQDEALAWQDLEVVNALLKNFGIKRLKGDDYETRVSKLLEHLTGEEQPLSGAELILRTTLKRTRRDTDFTKHWYEVPGDDLEEEEADEEEEE
jgi:hypothetical protein